MDAGFGRECFDAAAAGVLDEDAPVLGAKGVGNRWFEGPKRCAIDVRDPAFTDKGAWGGCESAESE